MNQRLGTFGRPTIGNSNHGTQQRHPVSSYPSSRLALNENARHSAENLTEIFPSQKTPLKQPIPMSTADKKSKQFCPDWRCILLCNMLVIVSIVGMMIAGYFYVWPEYIKLLEASNPIGRKFFEDGFFFLIFFLRQVILLNQKFRRPMVSLWFLVSLFSKLRQRRLSDSEKILLKPVARGWRSKLFRRR